MLFTSFSLCCSCWLCWLCYADYVHYANCVACYRHSQPCSHFDSLWCHSTPVGVISGPTVDANISPIFLWLSNIILYKSELFICSTSGGSIKDFDAQVKTLLHLRVRKRISYLPLALLEPLFIFEISIRASPVLQWFLILLFLRDSPMLDNYP